MVRMMKRFEESLLKDIMVEDIEIEKSLYMGYNIRILREGIVLKAVGQVFKDKKITVTNFRRQGRVRVPNVLKPANKYILTILTYYLDRGGKIIKTVKEVKHECVIKSDYNKIYMKIDNRKLYYNSVPVKKIGGDDIIGYHVITTDGQKHNGIDLPKEGF